MALLDSEIFFLVHRTIPTVKGVVAVSSVKGFSGAERQFFLLVADLLEESPRKLLQEFAACFSPFRSREGELDSARRILDFSGFAILTLFYLKAVGLAFLKTYTIFKITL